MKDFTGQVFGRLTVTKFHSWHVHPSGQKKTKWSCSCECGAEIIAQGANLSRGSTLSCGCLKKEHVSKAKKTHGMTDSKTYKTWRSLSARCLNVNSPDYLVYGAKGITVCDRWVISKGGSFENFLEDMGKRPEGKTLNRLKGASCYSKETCE